jgi:hypothetical protein
MFVIFTAPTVLYKSNGDYILQGYDVASEGNHDPIL